MAIPSSVSGATTVLTATISSAGFQSDVVTINGGMVVGLQMGTWKAASLTYLASADGVTYGSIYNGGSEATETVAALQYITTDPTKVYGMNYLKLQSGTSTSTTTQTSTATISVMVMTP